MDFIEWVIALGAVFGALVTIYNFVKKVSKPIIDVGEKVDMLVEHDKEQRLDILRLTLMSENMPISERLIAGKKYIKLGGNGECKKYYEKMIKEHTK